MSQDLGSRAVRGVAWLGSGQVIRIAMSFGTSVMLARLLPPSDFGLFTMTYMAAELAQLFAAFGFGSAIIQQQTTKPSILSSCFWTNIAIGLVVAIGLMVSGPLVELYFNAKGIVPLLLPLALNLMLSAGMVVPQALLTQRLQFKQLTGSQVMGSVAGALTAIAAAAAGVGVWALAFQPLVGNLVTGGLMLIYSRWFPVRRFAFADIRPLLRFSNHLLANNFLDFIARNLPTLIIGRFLGAAALGFYSMATGLTGVVIYQISSVIVRVLFPTLSAIKEDPKAMREAWFKATSGIAILAWPLMAGAVAVASDLIPVVFGKTWNPAVVPFQVLCGLMAVQAVATTSSTMLMAYGRADLMLRLTLVSTMAFAAALYAGAQFSITAVAVAYAGVGVLSLLASTWFAAREAHLDLLAMARELRPWAVASVGTGLLMGLAARVVPGMAPALRLPMCIVVGAVGYPALLHVFARQRTLALYDEIVSRWQKR